MGILDKLKFFGKKKEELPEFGPLPPLPGPGLPPVGPPAPPAPGYPGALEAREMAPLRPGVPEALGVPPALPRAIPAGMPPPPPPPVFTPRAPPKPAAPRVPMEEIEEVAEAIVSEKWQELQKGLSKVTEWKEGAEKEIADIKKETERLDKKLAQTEKAVLGKVAEYGKGIADVSTEVKAMQKVFKTIIPTLATNVKELGRIVEKAKKKG